LAGVAGVARRDHRSDSGAWDELPTVVRLLVMVVGAEGIELSERGVPRLGPGDAVVDLEGVRCAITS
jgi:hypothetical protein